MYSDCTRENVDCVGVNGVVLMIILEPTVMVLVGLMMSELL